MPLTGVPSACKLIGVQNARLSRDKDDTKWAANDFPPRASVGQARMTDKQHIHMDSSEMCRCLEPVYVYV